LEEDPRNWNFKVLTKLPKFLGVILISVVKIVSVSLVNFDDLPLWIDPRAESELEVTLGVSQQLLLHFTKRHILVQDILAFLKQ
jgi:hypothetical protein